MKKRSEFYLAGVVIMLFIFILPGTTSQNSMAEGFINLVILPNYDITIYSPESISYNVGQGACDAKYVLDLKVSANFDVDNWKYDLTSLNTKITVTNPFSPNTTINASGGSNIINIYANASGSGAVINKSVIFYINVSNHVPLLGSLPGEIFACESTNSFRYAVNAKDCDGDLLNIDNLQGAFGYFFFSESFPTINNVVSGETFAWRDILSVALKKEHAGRIYNINVSVTDGKGADTNKTKITVIEINNEPYYTKNISGAFTVYTKGDDSVFYLNASANDIEDGDQSSGNLSYTLSFIGQRLFNIAPNGEMLYIGNESHLGNHYATVCVTDKGIPVSRRHQNISFCGQGDGSNRSKCETFQIDVTNENRPPTITSYFPINLSFTSFGSDVLHFNITKYDPDGIIPDAYWYVDDVFVEIDRLSSFDEFYYTFGCGAQLKHKVRVDVTDGLLNDSLEWKFNLLNVQSCPVSSSGGGSGGGGGGGGGISKCNVTWYCRDWNVCQNAGKSLEIGTLNGNDFRKIEKVCNENKWDDSACGYQIRSCEDIRGCNFTRDKPEEIQSCIFTINPSCNDGIKNCHSGGCEFLVDCGGPCGACATCTDGKQNQGEQGIDCGGPCPYSCPVETAQKISFWRFWMILLSLLILIAGFLIYRVVKLRKKLKVEG